MAARSRRRREHRRRVAGAFGLLAVSVGIGGKTALAGFSATGSVAAATHTAGTITLNLSDPQAQSFDTEVISMYPGLTKQRLVDVTVGSVDIKALTLTRTADSANALADATTGLTLIIDRCSVAWTVASGSTPNETYTCSGTTTSWIGESASIVGTKTLTTGSNLTAGSINRYRATISLPSTSPSAAQGLTNVIHFTFNGTQRDGTNK